MDGAFSNIGLKTEGEEEGEAWNAELQRLDRARASLRGFTVGMAAEAGLAAGGKPRPATLSAPAEDYAGYYGGGGGNNDGGEHNIAVPLKTPKYTGRSNWEAFHAQFELLAQAGRWTLEHKALQLALCLQDDALDCLLLLGSEDRKDYNALVGALKRRFGQCVQPDVFKNKLSTRNRLAGEPLRVLANDIESLTRRAYAHMPSSVQNELAKDQFIRALSPPELRMQVQLIHPASLQEALDLAMERECLCGATAGGDQSGQPPACRAAKPTQLDQEKPAWVSELTELVRAVSLQSAQGSSATPALCWGCGQPGHLLRRCPKASRKQGNDTGAAEGRRRGPQL